MPELKRIRVRFARITDIGLFNKLWKALLEKNVEEGSIVEPTEEVMAMYNTLFDQYVNGNTEGIVLFVADKGVLMWGANESLFKYSPGNLIIAWGHYTSPDSPEGVEKALLDEAEKWAREKGYVGLMTHFHKEASKDFKPWATLTYKIFNNS